MNSDPSKAYYFLDEKDRKILSVLGKDARASIADIAEKTGIKRDSIAYRLEKMSREKLISFFLKVDDKMIGLGNISLIMVSLQNFDAEKEKQLRNFMDKYARISGYSLTSGKYDYHIRLMSKNQDELNEFMRDFRTRFSQIIKEIDVSNVVEGHEKTPEFKTGEN